MICYAPPTDFERCLELNQFLRWVVKQTGKRESGGRCFAIGIFAYHGYPWLIHRLTYRRRNHANIHVRGYKEEGAITTPFDMAVMNDMDRFHLVEDAIDRLPQLGGRGDYLKQEMRDKLVDHKEYIYEHGEDMPEVKDWKWKAPR